MSLRIELKHNYVITADKDNYILSKFITKKDKEGKETTSQSDKTFWPSMNMALKHYIKVIPIEQKEEITSIQDYLNTIHHLEAEVEELTEGH